jgi:hypothetical protein
LGEGFASPKPSAHFWDAIIAAIGSSGITRNLITALRDLGKGRVVMTSIRSVVATQPRLPVTLAWLIFHPAYSDLARAEGMLEASGLDWSVVRATILKPMPQVVTGVSRARITR